MSRDHDADAFLELADELDPTTYDILRRTLDAITARFPVGEEPDDNAPARAAAQSAAAQIAFGDATLESIADEYMAARAAAEEARAALSGAIIWAEAEAMPQTQIAALTGVTRMTVRKALGL